MICNNILNDIDEIANAFKVNILDNDLNNCINVLCILIGMIYKWYLVIIMKATLCDTQSWFLLIVYTKMVMVGLPALTEDGGFAAIESSRELNKKSRRRRRRRRRLLVWRESYSRSVSLGNDVQCC